MTSMFNRQTCAITNLDLIIAVITFTDSQTVEVTGDVVGGPGIGVPIGVDL
jgi:hypothetical protein